MSSSICDDFHRCDNGGACLENPKLEGAFYCECEGVYRGLSCEYEATEFCNTDNIMNPHSFCTNGGHCRKNVDEERTHYGCDCIGDYSGKFCELAPGQEIPDYWPGAPVAIAQHPESPSGFPRMAILIPVMLVFAIGGFAFFRRRRLSQQALMKSAGKDSSTLSLDADGSALASEFSPKPKSKTVEEEKKEDVDNADLI